MEFVEFFSIIKIPMTIVHVISVVFGMGAALVSDLLFTFYSKDKKLSSVETKTLWLLSNVVWIGLIVIALSGVGIFLSDIPKYTHSVKFLAKMSILAVLVINGYVLHKYVWKHVIKKGFLTNVHEGVMRKLAFTCGAISVLSWLFTCALGVLDKVSISYATIMMGYGIIVALGITVALIVEYRTFER